MSDTKRLEAELELAKASEKLEAAREKMHAKRTEANIAAYQKESDKVAALRQAFRQNYQAQPGPDDAAPKVDTLTVKTGVHR
jgi:predicted  nucleic acid-binding Zn-ribbon protein